MTTLADAVRDLQTAITRIWNPLQTTTGHWTPSLWNQMRDAIHDTPQTNTRGAFGERPPAMVDAIDWCAMVDHGTAVMTGTRTGSPDQRLRNIAVVQAWSPHQTDTVISHAATVHQWARTAEQYLGQESRMEVKAACPECDRKVFHTTNQYGEPIAKPALEATVHECRCLVCGTRWGNEQFELLAAVLKAEVTE